MMKSSTGGTNRVSGGGVTSEHPRLSGKCVGNDYEGKFRMENTDI